MCFCSTIAPQRLSKYGIDRLKCGSCPECLQERANLWVLRCVAEARYRRSRGEKCCMITLTYDQFLRDAQGNVLRDKRGVPLELPVDVEKVCDKRHVQLFMKRLRFRFGPNIKYLITAEHGKRTHRAHYHAILFGVDFPDLVPYKKSNRGNQIFFSKTLCDLWKHGICTVDSVNIQGSMARYVTKYSMKQKGCDDTFQLFSHGIGEEWLYQHFTGRPYIIEGREYSVPRTIWNRYIMDTYAGKGRFACFPMTSVYRRIGSMPLLQFEFYQLAHRKFIEARDSDPLYQAYRARLKERSDLYQRFQSPDEVRVLNLDSRKYFGYKSAWFARWRRDGLILDPMSSERKVNYVFEKISVQHGRDFGHKPMCHLPKMSRHYTANDSGVPMSFEDSEIFSKNIGKTIDKFRFLI